MTYPEASITVTLEADGVQVLRPDAAPEYVAWKDLRAVLIQTTDEGPWAVDVYWILLGTPGGCVVPQGAAGEEGLLARLQQLPGFDNNAVIAAMASTGNQRFLCWERPAQDPL